MKMSEEKQTSDAAEEEVESDPLKKLPDLKALREARGLTIKDIFLKTRISVTNLQAIENGEFHLLPTPVYAIKFIQIYSKAIGIDAGNILAHYQRHLGEIQAVPEEVPVVKAQIAFDLKPFKRYLAYAAPAVAIIAVVFAIYTFFHVNETGIIQQNVTVAESKEVVPKPTPAVKEQPRETVAHVPPSPPPAMAVNEVTKQTPGNDYLNLLIEATEDTWLKITEDSNDSYQVTLKKGDKLSRKARKFFIVDVGNAAGVNITFQGKSLENLGRKGQVVHLRLPQQ
jgi:cytoskeletal protein RodZ